ncbi:TIGR03986 family CRISPR-associated RAMP protein [Emticicia sp. BO119]|uniref:TIGR03986 family type III CRISPR-associated RAMP protein n=1 Tax=Emticicia sp. BO119 TaxID=2757768 RepID=UPI0015F0C5FF|nr:TIGR03986 family CRISPR-associated RAMP protein [Emticicia sp. BO119]MBA4848975.1 TIGR03986 family CRISPR-associated RAMP protein [Emticicia sp. BO119]
MVKSPYNFVPAPSEGEVFTPHWADDVSHDIPFEDGESGEISVCITAETPIFVRNGHAEGEEMNEFCHVGKEADKQYFIPATTFKGLIRNTLEVISQSGMKQIDDSRHSIRQIMKTKDVIIDEGYELTGKKDDIYCGYLIKKDDRYWIYSCDKPYKIRYTDLDKIFDGGFSRNFENGVSNNFDERTGAFKYENIIKGTELEHIFEEHPLDETDKQKAWVSIFQRLKYVRLKSVDKNAFWGRIVCTGQASEYSAKISRRGEYVFRGRKEEILKDDKRKIEVLQKQMDTFLFLNRDGKKDSEILKDWKYWKDSIKTGIPVFFRKKDSTLIDFGLTFMYKQPVRFSTKEILSYKPDLDLAECIFGSIQKNYELKGRVFISDMKAKGKVKVLPLLDNVLSSPKSSYSPFYLNQDTNQQTLSAYNTYQVGNPSLRGFKKYPIRANESKQTIDSSKQKLISRSMPLSKGTVFEGKIRFHNLKRTEIGALISSLTLHGSENVFYNIGAIKPLGFGRVKIAIDTNFDQDSLMKEFEKFMRVHNENAWKNSLKELLAMSSIAADERTLDYMTLENFQKVKNQGLYLQQYSKISEINKNIRFLATPAEIEEARIRIKNEINVNKERKEYYLNLAKNQLENDAYDEASKSYKLYAESNRKFDLKTTLSEIEKIKKLFIKFTELNTSDDLSVLESSLKDFYHTKWYQLLQNKIQQIKTDIRKRLLQLAAEEKLNLDDSAFDKIKAELKKREKKNIAFSEEWRKEIEESLKRNYVHEKNNKKSEWQKGAFPKYPWSDIIKWLGPDKAKALYEELTKP